MEESLKPEIFDVSKSPLKTAYELLGAKSPLELNNLYSIEDQKLMKSLDWDYESPNLITNKVKILLENVDEAFLTDDEKEWRREILWFWYHHATSCAIFLHHDIEKSKEFVIKALEYQGDDHPNKITKLLYFLVNDRLPEAEEWTNRILNNIERDTALHLITQYKEKGFF